MTRPSARLACCALVSLAVFASAAQAANPMAVAYKYTTNVSLYARPTGMIIAGRCNWQDPAFTNVRTRGGEVLVYINPISRPDHRVCALDERFYMSDIGAVPLWPYPSYGQRQNWANTRMTDMRPGSAWIRYVVSYVERLMRENRVDGVFLDGVGARPWGALVEYSSWSTTEKNTWTDGNVDLVRRLDAVRRAVRPSFIIVNNNVWDRGEPRGLVGERYVDGVMLEHPRAGSAWHIKYVGKPFSNLGHRRVLVIANNRTEAQAWARVPGVTHVSDQTGSQYAQPNVPAIGFQDLNDR